MQDQITSVYQTSKSYPETAYRLAQLGITSYTVDVATNTILYRTSEGNTHLHAGNSQREITPSFSREKTFDAVKATQQGKLPYPEFMNEIAKCGVRFYEATLQGENKRVCYIGSGGFYEENIPEFA